MQFLSYKTKVLIRFTIIEYNHVEISNFHLASFIDGTLDHCLQNNNIPIRWSPLCSEMFTEETYHRFIRITATTK
jgi:predicted oxidoreductase